VLYHMYVIVALAECFGRACYRFQRNHPVRYQERTKQKSHGEELTDQF
jgi:hypothetical protein